MKYSILLYMFLLITISAQSSSSMLDIYYEKQLLQEEFDRKLTENKNFKYALGSRESGMNEKIINPIGAMGVWQFMSYTLSDLGYGFITPYSFSKNPEIFPIELQEEVLDLKISRDLALLTHQWWRGNRSINYIEKYVGTKVYGVEVTLSGILAAAHLGGAGGVIRFFDTMGGYNPSDIFGTSLFSYLRDFSKYKFHYNNLVELKKKIECLEDSLNKPSNLILLSKQSKLNLKELHLRGTETVLTLEQVKLIHLAQNTQESTMYLLALEQNFQNIIEEYYSSEVLHLKSMILTCQWDMEKLSGIMPVNGRGLSEPIKHLKRLKKEIEYFNSTLSRYGIPPGTSNSYIFFQYLGLKKLTHLPHLGVA